jgi:hypothetical protein
MLSQYARLSRPYLVALGIVTAGRWVLSFRVPYEQGTNIFSIVTLTLFASFFSAIFLRRWRGFRLGDAAAFAVFMAVVSQAVVWLSTAASYALGVSSYFSHPMALNRQLEPVSFLAAMGFRAGGLVVNVFINGIAGALGWALGALLPAKAS